MHILIISKVLVFYSLVIPESETLLLKIMLHSLFYKMNRSG